MGNVGSRFFFLDALTKKSKKTIPLILFELSFGDQRHFKKLKISNGKKQFSCDLWQNGG